jgi:hypothetical protein
MIIANRRIAAVALFAALPLLVTAVSAEEWTRTGPGGTVTRTWDQDTKTGTVERSSARGGSTSATVDCAFASAAGCQRSVTATGPGGHTVEGQRTSVVGPFRGRTATTVTGPQGNTVMRRGRWRR